MNRRVSCGRFTLAGVLSGVLNLVNAAEFRTEKRILSQRSLLFVTFRLKAAIDANPWHNPASKKFGRIGGGRQLTKIAIFELLKAQFGTPGTSIICVY